MLVRKDLVLRRFSFFFLCIQVQYIDRFSFVSTPVFDAPRESISVVFFYRRHNKKLRTYTLHEQVWTIRHAGDTFKRGRKKTVGVRGSNFAILCSSCFGIAFLWSIIFTHRYSTGFYRHKKQLQYLIAVLRINKPCVVGRVVGRSHTNKNRQPSGKKQ